MRCLEALLVLNLSAEVPAHISRLTKFQTHTVFEELKFEIQHS